MSPAGEADDLEFRKLLSWAYRGEVSGDVLFTALAQQVAFSRHRAQLETLAELERHMAAVVSPLLDEVGVTGGDEKRAHRDALAAAEMLGTRTWDEFLAEFEPTTQAALDRYRRLASLGAPACQPVLQLLVEHEEAIREFGRREKRGHAADALQPVEAMIAVLRRTMIEAQQ